MSMQYVVTIELPRVSIDRVVPAAGAVPMSGRADGAAWPPDGSALRPPAVRGVWSVREDRVTFTWA
jgi:hypothetical protein